MTFKVKVLMKNGIKLKLLFFTTTNFIQKINKLKKQSQSKKKLKFNQL
jgi:hypothetical protein